MHHINIVERKVIHHLEVGEDLMLSALCNQMGQEVVICKNKNQQNSDGAKDVGQEEEEDYLFVTTRFSSTESNENRFINGGCTNHMTHNKDLFRELSNASSSNVRVGNGHYIVIKGKGTIAIST